MQVLFLLDENIAAPLADKLDKAGHDVERVVNVSELGEGVDDTTIRLYAVREGRIIVTSDNDFVQMPVDSRDILLAVNGEASRTTGGIFAGLRYNLFSRGERPALAVEQVYRWLCHTAVTPILTVRTRSYLLSHVLCPVTIRVPD